MFKYLLTVALLVSQPVAAYTAKDVKCLADNAFYEARDQGIKGMQAVIDVTLNRVASKRFPNTVCKVVYQRKQFSWTHQKKQKVTQKELEIQYEQALHLARGMLIGFGRGITKGSEWYHETDISPSWSKSKKIKRTKTIKSHMFYAAN